jgi:hypothetical protein
VCKLYMLMMMVILNLVFQVCANNTKLIQNRKKPLQRNSNLCWKKIID